MQLYVYSIAHPHSYLFALHGATVRTRPRPAQLAPLSLHEVLQVTSLPAMQDLQTSRH
jgi:hypothetical protein